MLNIPRHGRKNGTTRRQGTLQAINVKNCFGSAWSLKLDVTIPRDHEFLCFRDQEQVLLRLLKGDDKALWFFRQVVACSA
jgi:hypothetical protein